MKFDWWDQSGQNCESEQCKMIYVYDKEMSNFDVVEALKSTNKTTYHARKFKHVI